MYPSSTRVVYSKGSLKNLDKDGDGIPDHLRFKLVNLRGTGGIRLSIKVLVDGRDVTSKTTIQVADQKPRPIKPSIYVYSIYGDELTFEVRHGGEIKAGPHKVRLVSDIGPVEFEDSV
ncbi:TPA: hypothetical protein EYP44_03025 [Candidatus Bathyarchaeota archaeon]|nr:hypothetical protein [Candidatus Bathyarchaeota archaeon]